MYSEWDCAMENINPLSWFAIALSILCDFSSKCRLFYYQVVADSNFKYVLEIKDVPKFKDART